MSILSLFLKYLQDYFEENLVLCSLHNLFWQIYMISMINATFGACLMTVLITINPIVEFQARW